MDVISVSKPKTLGAFLALEYDPNHCRESVLLLAGSGAVRTLAQFSLVMLAALTATAVADVGNTGTGAFGTVTADVGAKLGDWRVVCIEPGTNAGTFMVIDPDGVEIGEPVVAAAYNGPLNFTIADGTDFVAGDGFTVTVAGSGKVILWDGVGRVYGASLFETTAPDGADAQLTILRRGPATIVRDEIAWHAGVTDSQKASAYTQLDALGIIARAGA